MAVTDAMGETEYRFVLKLRLRRIFLKKLIEAHRKLDLHRLIPAMNFNKKLMLLMHIIKAGECSLADLLDAECRRNVADRKHCS